MTMTPSGAAVSHALQHPILSPPYQKPLAAARTEPALLLLPDTVMERILLATGHQRELRHVCKAFSSVIAKSSTALKIPREILSNHGSLLRALSAFPNSKRLVLDLSRNKESPLSSIGAEQRLFTEKEEDEDDAALVDGALDALAALRHPLTSLTILHLSRPLPLPSTATLDYLASCGISELQLQDVSIQRSASDGASNLLRSHSPPSPSLPGQLLGSSLADSIRARGAAMVRFACCLPTLQRLSLCNAAFSSGDVAALATLTQLQELSLDGAMECTPCSQFAANSPLQNLFPEAPAASAGPAFKTVLASLPRLRRLQLPMAIRAGPQRELLDSDDDDDDGDEDAFEDRLDSDSGRRNSRCACGVDVCTCGNGSAAGGWVFPPLLEELTIPLCSLNGPVFRAACEAYGRRHCGDIESEHERAERGSAPVRGLRALHITCAPGYTVWVGSFLKADRDFAALSLLGSSLECLHLSLELRGSGQGALTSDRLRTCLRHLRSLARLKVLEVAETRQPVCFGVSRKCGARPDVLSYLLDVAYSVGPRPRAEPRLPLLPQLNGQPHGIRFWSRGGGGAPSPGPRASGASAATTAAAVASAPAFTPLDSLLVPWPHLETLVVCGQRAVRSGRGCHTRLVLLESLEQMMEVY
ncbi:hypothetical protein PLESTB_000119900 [Pleodorina starrii]|uniref:F-box domain-containing protein n=1 Tax=Pleodorina starrii TaxID=330485 RepID=A0A9W6BAT3_9CHLO|nr:hypothetical protein PLESTB_000119900 [Pleodorina starrii]GLC76358.1 hypothetical protein PLESTF_001770900 [Pleodorina starrii]